MKKTGIFLIVGGALTLYFLSRLSFKNKAIFLLQSIRPGGSILSPRIILSFAVQNPTNQKILFKSITGELYADGKYLANVSQFGDQIINPNSETIFNITVKPSALGIFSAIKQILNTPKGENKFEFIGNANIDGIVISVNESITV